MKHKHPYQNAEFLLSAYSLSQLPPDTGKEIAFIGRSNAGKSSALNALTSSKKLARVSKTPGRTQAINVFVIDQKRRLIDLPGYGYAKAPKKLQAEWQETINQYLQKRRSLCGLVLLMDIRHPLQKLDQQLLAWAIECELPIHILLTKADKLKYGQALKKFQQVEQEIKHYTNITLQTFSALTHDGVEDALIQLDTWLTEE